MAVVVDVATAVRSHMSSRQVFAGRAGVMVVLGVVDEVLPGEQAALGPARRQGLGHDRGDARAFAREDLVAVVVAAVSKGDDLLATGGLLSLECHGRKLVAVVTLVDYLVGHDQMVLRVDGDLYIVSD